MTITHRYARAAKRELDRGIRVIEQGGRPSQDPVFRARQRVTEHWWNLLPDKARASIRNPLADA